MILAIRIILMVIGLKAVSFGKVEQMAKYIDAEKFEREMYHEAFETDSYMQKWDGGCWIRYKMFENCIAHQPAVEVVRCKECVLHNKCITEDGFNLVGKTDGFCCVGRKKAGEQK